MAESSFDNELNDAMYFLFIVLSLFSETKL